LVAVRQFYGSSASVLYVFDFPLQLQLALEWLCLWVQLAIVADDVLLCLKEIINLILINTRI
jgi:hypothetical protein